MENDPDYVRVLQNLPEKRRKAMLEGNWDVFEGQFFEDWDDKKHVIEPFELPLDWNKFISIDWGFNDHYAVYWHTTAPDGHIYTYRELWGRQKHVDELSELIKANTPVEEKISYRVGSPDMWQTRGTGSDIKGENIAEMFAKNGLPFIKADNARIVGWNRMKEYLQVSPDGRPWWQITSNCRNLIEHIPQAIYDDKIVEDMCTEPHEITDTLDSCRYFLMSRPTITRKKETPIDKTYYSQGELEDLGMATPKKDRNSIVARRR